MDEYEASNFTQPSNFGAAIKSGKTLLGVGISFPSVAVASKSAITGYDWAFIDAEHAPFSPILLADIIQAVSFHSQGKTVPVVRVPSHEPSFISVALDAGAAGIILPHTETREQAEYLVKNCRFPPLGKRSYPPWSWIPGINDQVPEGETIATLSNKHIVCIAQIESALGVQNAEDIMSVEGIDCVMIGTGDLQMDMGFKFDWYSKEPEYLAAIARIESLARKYNKPLMALALPSMTEVFEDRVRKGYQLLAIATDSYTLTYTLAATSLQSRQTVTVLQSEMKAEQEAKGKAANAEKVHLNAPVLATTVEA